MADEIKSDTTAPAASPAAPLVEAAPSSPAITEPVVAPVEAAPVVEPAKPEIAPAESKKVETLLGETKKVEEAKPAEKAPEVKVEDAPKAEEAKPVELPVYESFKVPEGITLDNDKLGDFTKSLAEFELKSKAPHEEVQALGQQMMDRYLGEMQRYTDSLTSAWNKQKNDWKESFLKDPEFTNRTNTVLNAAIDVIDTYGGSADQAKEFRELMESTGVGNHPAMIRLLSNIKLAKPEPKQLAAPQIASPIKTSKISKMYGNKTGK